MLTGETGCMSEFLSYPLTDRASWERLWQDRFAVDFSLHVPRDWEGQAAQLRAAAKEKYLMARGYSIMGAVGGLRQMMGLGDFAYALADDPDWIREMWRQLIALWKSIFDRALKDVPIDHVIFFEDMCAKHGPLISPQMYQDFFGGGYSELIAFLRERGVHLFDLDTDGNAVRMIPAYLGLGDNMLSPCQASAGMGAEEVLRAYPTLQLHGGIDNTILAFGDRQTIEDEVRRKYAAAWRYSRYIPAPEHGIAHNVSWDNIRYFADACLRYSVQAPQEETVEARLFFPGRVRVKRGRFVMVARHIPSKRWQRVLRNWRLYLLLPVVVYFISSCSPCCSTRCAANGTKSLCRP